MSAWQPIPAQVGSNNMNHDLFIKANCLISRRPRVVRCVPHPHAAAGGPPTESSASGRRYS
eukprot:1434017-Prymnesium_polylepis.1